MANADATSNVPHGQGGPGQYWQGKGPLWRIYWIYGVGASAIMAAIYALAFAQGAVWLQQILLPIFLVYTGWILVAVWRCAPNTDKELYMVLARVLTAAWAINTILVLFFLQLHLIRLY